MWRAIQLKIKNHVLCFDPQLTDLRGLRTLHTKNVRLYVALNAKNVTLHAPVLTFFYFHKKTVPFTLKYYFVINNYKYFCLS